MDAISTSTATVTPLQRGEPSTMVALNAPVELVGSYTGTKIRVEIHLGGIGPTKLIDRLRISAARRVGLVAQLVADLVALTYWSLVRTTLWKTNPGQIVSGRCSFRIPLDLVLFHPNSACAYGQENEVGESAVTSAQFARPIDRGLDCALATQQPFESLPKVRTKDGVNNGIERRVHVAEPEEDTSHGVVEDVP